MNYLGHIYLSDRSPKIMVGNLITDMLTLAESRQLKGDFQLGIQLHRKIDAYTDGNPHVQEVNRILQPVQGKYASVVSDILFDFLICHNWYRLTDCSFDEFCQTAYNYIMATKNTLPLKISARLESMVHHRWLHAQAHTDGLLRSLQRMDQRTRFPSNFHLALGQLLEKFELINRLFMAFLLEIQEEVPNWKSSLRS